MQYSLFMNSIASAFGTGSTAEKWRFATKTNNTYAQRISAEMVFRYHQDDTTFNLAGKQMVLLHLGSDAAQSGAAVVLRQSAVGNVFTIGIIYSPQSGTWTDVVFTNLSSIADVSTNGFYFLMQYEVISSQNFNVYFNLVQFSDSTTKTAPDFTFTGTLTNFNSGNHVGMGSEVHTITDPTGYMNTDGYNSFVAQNLEVLQLRLWDVDPILSVDSSNNGQYAMFNDEFPLFSLYAISKAHSSVPAGTIGMNYQMFISTTNLSNVYNSADNNPLYYPPGHPVTLTTNPSTFPSLPDFAINSDTVYTIAQPTTIPCLLAGTMIVTPFGRMRVEDLRVGDHVMTFDGRKVTVKSTMKTVMHVTPEHFPVRIPKGLYEATEDLYLSPLHAVLTWDDALDNFVFIKAKDLPDVDQVLPEGGAVVTYVHVQTGDYLADTLIANGVPVETWCGCRPEKKERYEIPPELLLDNFPDRRVWKISWDPFSHVSDSTAGRLIYLRRNG